MNPYVKGILGTLAVLEVMFYAFTYYMVSQCPPELVCLWSFPPGMTETFMVAVSAAVIGVGIGFQMSR